MLSLSSVSLIHWHISSRALQDQAIPESELGEVVPKRCGAIHIELPGEVRISLEGSVDPAVVRAVLRSLRS